MDRFSEKARCGNVLSTFLAMILVPAALSQEVSRETIRASWQDRENRSHSFKMSWTIKQFVPKGLYTDPLAPGPLVVAPERDSWIEKNCSLSFEGSKMRYSYVGQVWGPVLRAFKKETYCSTFDGKVGKTFNADGADIDPTPDGMISVGNSYMDFRFGAIEIIRSVFRANHQIYRVVDLSNARILPHIVRINGARCIELRVREGSGQSSIETVSYLDVEKSFVVARREIHTSGKLQSASNIWYQTDDQVGWRPSRWETVSSSADGKSDRMSKVTVTMFESGMAFPEEEFDIRYPTNARVYNEVARKSRVVTAKNGEFIDIEHRSVLSRNWLALSGIGMAFMFLILALWTRRVRLRSRTPSS